MSDRHIGGLHAVKAALSSSAGGIELLYLQEDRRDRRVRELKSLAQKHAVRCELVSREVLDKLVNSFPHQGAVVVLQSQSHGVRADLLGHLQERLLNGNDKKLLILILDEIQDPRNLGACLRCADAAGADAVVVPASNSAGLSAAARKVASGAAESVAFFQVPNLKRTISELQSLGVWVYGAAEEADDTLYDLDLCSSIALVMGAEGKGLRRLTREQCDGLYRLPMEGQVSSLNVSVAAGISLFEAIRQRRPAS
ncbi:MAG: 23S rRNA (guanosine(2251)-2'-O)-methyltransferase RlmB [Granulosicoccus sp.]|nr:23S rRNA (guanosine(2251)-2'-O)-methyltransferase RlmB [Granulosicoccus sp.]